MKYELIEMPMGAGVNRYTDAPHLAHGELRTAINLRYYNPPTLAHRLGHYERNLTSSSGGSVTTGARLIAHKDTVCVATADKLYQWAPTEEVVSDRGYLSECMVSRRGIHSDFVATLSDASCTYSSEGYYVYVWSGTTAGTHVAIVDEKNGAVVASQVLLLAGLPSCELPRVFMCGTTCWILTKSTGTSILYTKADLSSTLTFPQLTAMSTTSGANTTDCTFDAAPISSTVFAVVYEDNVTGNVIVDTISQTPAVVNTATLVTAGDVVALGVEGVSGEGVFVAWADDTNGLRCSAYSTALALDSTSTMDSAVITPSRVGLARTSSAVRVVVWEVPDDGTNRPHMAWRTKTLGGGPGPGPNRLHDVVPTGKPFFMNTPTASSVFVLAAFESDFQATYYLVELQRDQVVVQTSSIGGRWVATAARGLGTASTYTGYLYGCAVNTTVDTPTYKTATYPALIKSRFQFAGGQDEEIILARTRVDSLSFEFNDPKLHSYVSWGDGIFVAGGRPSWFDGVYATEHGFAWYPEYMTVDGAISGDPTPLTVGSYGYDITYDTEDANGYVVRSAPWTDTVAVDPGEDSITSTWDQSIELTARNALTNKIRAFGYRTLVDETEPRYRGSSQTTGFPATVGSGSSSLSADDDVIDDFEVSYTSGGILDNAGTPPCKFCCLHGDRVWIGGLEDPDYIWFSQPYQEREQPRFNEGLRVAIGKPARAMASMDAQLIVWTDDGIFAVAGTGPPATGGLDVGFEARPISTDVGCIDWRSVVLSPVGLFFQSRKGIYLLDRGLNTTFIGAPIHDYLSSRATIVAAIAEEENPTVIFLIEVGGSDTVSVRLVYNYQVKNWTVDTLPFLALDMKMAWDGAQQKRVPCMVTATDIWFETDLFPYDGTDAIPIDTELSWGDIKLSGAVQGWERIRVMQALFGNAPGSASIFIDFSFDYGNTYTETHTFTVAEQQAAGTRLQVDLTRQECQAVRPRIREKNKGNSGVQYRSIVFEGGIMPGPKQLAAGAKK